MQSTQWFYVETQKWEKTMELLYYIKLKLYPFYQYQLEGGYKPLDLPTPNGRKHQLPRFSSTN